MPGQRQPLPADWYGYPADTPSTRFTERRVRCEDCALRVANPHNPDAGMGGCELGLIGQYPAALHFCRDFMPAVKSTPSAASNATPEGNP
jgi:hypothetical protein